MAMIKFTKNIPTNNRGTDKAITTNKDLITTAHHFQSRIMHPMPQMIPQDMGSELRVSTVHTDAIGGHTHCQLRQGKINLQSLLQDTSVSFFERPSFKTYETTLNASWRIHGAPTTLYSLGDNFVYPICSPSFLILSIPLASSPLAH